MIYLLPQFHALVATRLSNLLVRSDLGVLDLPIVSGTPWWFLWLAWGTRRLYFCRLYPSMIGFSFLSIRVYVVPFSSFFPEAVSAQVWDPCKRIVSVVALKSMIFRLFSQERSISLIPFWTLGLPEGILSNHPCLSVRVSVRVSIFKYLKRQFISGHIHQSL